MLKNIVNTPIKNLIIKPHRETIQEYEETKGEKEVEEYLYSKYNLHPYIFKK